MGGSDYTPPKQVRLQTVQGVPDRLSEYLLGGVPALNPDWEPLIAWAVRIRGVIRN